MIGLIKNAVNILRTPVVRENLGKIITVVGTAKTTVDAQSPIARVADMVFKGFDFSSPKAATSEIQPAVEIVAEHMSDTTVNYFGNALASALNYVLQAPLHTLYSIGYSVPIAVWKGVTLKNIKSNAITRGTDVLIYIGQDANGTLVFKAGKALFVAIQIAVVKGIITIIVLYICYKIIKFTVEKSLTLVYTQIDKHENKQISNYEDGY